MRIHSRTISQAREFRALAGKTAASRELVASISRIRIIDGYYQFRLCVGDRWNVRADTDRISIEL